MTAENPAIAARGLTKRFGRTTVVDGVDLSIQQGSIFGFLGPNGAGKTTTIRMLTGLTTPTSGEATVCGTPVTDRASLRAHVGFLPEEPPVFDELTGYEQLQYFGRLRGLTADERDERIRYWLDRFDLTDDADVRIDDYSKGMRQKVGLIQALLAEPSVLFLDEPTSGLDPRAARTVTDVVADQAAAGRTVFLSTHILPVVEDLADVVGVLHQGRIVEEGEPAALVDRAASGEDASLEDVFLAVTTDRTEGRPVSKMAADNVDSVREHTARDHD